MNPESSDNSASNSNSNGSSNGYSSSNGNSSRNPTLGNDSSLESPAPRPIAETGSSDVQTSPSLRDNTDSTRLLAELIRAIYTADDERLAELVAAVRRAASTADISSSVAAAMSNAPEGSHIPRAYVELLSELSRSNGSYGSSSSEENEPPPQAPPGNN